MSFLTELLKETAAGAVTSAHSVATGNGSLFGGGIVDSTKKKPSKRQLLRRITAIPVEESLAKSDELPFDPADVISKLEANEKKSKAEKNTTAFGLEDEDGRMVKVYVKSDQADAFESTLSAMLGGQDDDEDLDNSALEIAEVLYMIKDKFEIVDVEWPTIDGDEEEEISDEDDESKEGEVDGEENDDADDEENGKAAVDDSAAVSALDKVIDVMKADAEAKQAEAEAREAEARAKEAEASTKAASERAKQEEQVLDMEAEEQAIKDEKAEAKKMAELARFQHRKAQEVELETVAEREDKNSEKDKNDNEDEDDEDDSNEISLEELSNLIIKNLQHQG